MGTKTLNRTGKHIVGFLIMFTVCIFAGMLFQMRAVAYEAVVGDGYITFDFNDVSCGIVNQKTTATYKKNVEFEGRTAVKFTPTPDLSPGGGLTLDCFTLDKYEDKVTVPDYKFVGITYYYDTRTPTYADFMQLSILPGKTGATGNLSDSASMPIVTGQWAEAFFSFSLSMKLLNEEMPYINQIHFSPFGSTSSLLLKETDVIYIEKITFYKENPDPNAVSKYEFVKSSPDAVGENLCLYYKPGTQITLPDSHFVYKNAEFVGWRSSLDGELYTAGSPVTVVDGDVVYTGVWNVIPDGVAGRFISLDYKEYQNGIVDHRDSAFISKADLGGGQVVTMVTPNPESTRQLVALDGFSYLGANIDLKLFQWIVVDYLYEAENPVDDYMTMDILTNGGAVTKRLSKKSTEKIKSGAWSTAVFDFTDMDPYLTPNLTQNLLKQLHFMCFGSAKPASMSADDRMYIRRIMFFRDKPGFSVHNAYMYGYEDATFRPGETLTRAEAAAIAARVYTNSDEQSIEGQNTVGQSGFSDVSQDKWYAKYIGFCVQKGIIPCDGGKFYPERDITKNEFASMMMNVVMAEESGETVVPEVSLLAEDVSGTTITRLEAAMLVNNARGHTSDKVNILNDFSVLFVDVDHTHWAFEALTEATVGHVVCDGDWVYPLGNPLAEIVDRVSPEKYFNTELGNKKVSELDALEQARINEIRNSPSMSLDGIKGDIFYVSPDGDDSGNGTIEKPFKTIKFALSAAGRGDAVLLERGGLWREKISIPSGVTVSAYGTGDKPKIYGSPENGADASKWTLVYYDDKTGARIWRYANQKMKDVGTLVLDGGEGFAMKEIPTSKGKNYVVRGDTSTPFDYRKELDRNFEFFHKANSVVSGSIINAGSSVGPLYFRCDNGNPGEVFDSIEFNTKDNVVGVGASNVTVDNLCIMYGGSHGIGAGTVENLTVTNCEIGWIGGSIQSYNANGNTDGSATRFGNGIEVYGGCKGYTIDNCYVYQCYDAGITHQLSGLTKGNFEMTDVLYYDNLITECVYSIEYFFGTYVNDASLYKRYGKGVVFENNFLRRAGYGFGSFRPDGNNQRHIRSGSSQNWFEDFVIRNNIFDRSVHELLQCVSRFEACVPIMQGNTYIQGVDNRVFTFGTNSASAYADAMLGYNVSDILGDATGVIYFTPKIPYWEYTYTNPAYISKNPTVYPETEEEIFDTAQ